MLSKTNRAKPRAAGIKHKLKEPLSLVVLSSNFSYFLTHPGSWNGTNVCVRKLLVDSMLANFYQKVLFSRGEFP